MKVFALFAALIFSSTQSLCGEILSSPTQVNLNKQLVVINQGQSSRESIRSFQVFRVREEWIVLLQLRNPIRIAGTGLSLHASISFINESRLTDFKKMLMSREALEVMIPFAGMPSILPFKVASGILVKESHLRTLYDPKNDLRGIHDLIENLGRFPSAGFVTATAYETKIRFKEGNVLGMPTPLDPGIGHRLMILGSEGRSVEPSQTIHFIEPPNSQGNMPILLTPVPRAWLDFKELSIKIITENRVLSIGFNTLEEANNAYELLVNTKAKMSLAVGINHPAIAGSWANSKLDNAEIPGHAVELFSENTRPRILDSTLYSKLHLKKDASFAIDTMQVDGHFLELWFGPRAVQINFLQGDSYDVQNDPQLMLNKLKDGPPVKIGLLDSAAAGRLAKELAKPAENREGENAQALQISPDSLWIRPSTGSKKSQRLSCREFLEIPL